MVLYVGVSGLDSWVMIHYFFGGDVIYDLERIYMREAG